VKMIYEHPDDVGALLVSCAFWRCVLAHGVPIHPVELGHHYTFVDGRCVLVDRDLSLCFPSCAILHDGSGTKPTHNVKQ